MKWNFQIDDVAGEFVQSTHAKKIIDFRLGYLFRDNSLSKNDIATTISHQRSARHSQPRKNSVMLTREYETNARHISRAQAALAAARVARPLNDALK